ncbi:ABC-type transport auxiliary lipoprotein family protein [Albimonas sp. CAU 1670]|uniref:ABC-type transport auxiliary lipoprotein family protein n=1 Tax=Albimonas sp. CAU 1670 TaxID=3032599 RepID=UPI0023DC9112|nr:ABC-type transport auxiliary lipoprotein family protein [Albimonas sp. CAU 1670]MDF2231856.1 ABC-type transport auxiliary lipoprotein family protein [Albimonas sp. CAU 1670]
MSPTAAFRARRGLVLATAACLGLTGCAELASIGGVATAPDLYSLSPKSTFASDLPEVGAQIVVEAPTADASVNTDRIAIKPNPLQVKYFSGARWVDRAPLVVQRLMVESFENTGKVAAVSQSSVGLRNDFTVITDLREFQGELQQGAPVEGPDSKPVLARVRLNIKIIQEPQGLIIGSQAFPAAVEATEPGMLAVANAFDEALGRAMRNAVEWTIRTIDAAEERRPARYPGY